MTTQVRIRDLCTKCSGSGHNGISEEEAKRRADDFNFSNTVHSPVKRYPYQERICKECNGSGGINERWVALSELHDL